MEKLMKARKSHMCQCCEQPIDIGEDYWFGKGRGPRFGQGDSDIQVGVQFYEYHLCFHCVDKMEKNKDWE